jgi:hypothetical protein
MNSDSTSLAATLRAAGAYYKNDRLRDAESVLPPGACDRSDPWSRATQPCTYLYQGKPV